MAMALPAIIVGAVVISIAAWLYYAFSQPRNKRIAIILNGFAIICFLAGESISNGPNPRHYYGGFKSGGTIRSGPGWGFGVGLSLAITLMIIAYYFAKKRPRDESPRTVPRSGKHSKKASRLDPAPKRGARKL